LAILLLFLGTTPRGGNQEARMATKQNENSVQFSLHELSQMEEQRRQDEAAKARARAAEEARQAAEREERARRAALEQEMRRAAEEASADARLHAEAMLARERARAAEQEAAAAVPVVGPAPKRNASALMGLAAMLLSVVGLGITAGYLATQERAPVRVVDRPISIFTTERVEPAVEEPTTPPGTTGEVTPKTPRVPRTPKVPKTTKQQEDCRRDPLCNLDVKNLGK
jgi:hypothetical protein